MPINRQVAMERAVSRNMWILAALIAAFMIAVMYQESTGSIERPWAECKESLVQQMLSGNCTPVSGSMRAPGPGGTSEPPPPDQADRPVGEIKLK